jgi:predicted transcriptional regulator of viral defense system
MPPQSKLAKNLPQIKAEIEKLPERIYNLEEIQNLLEQLRTKHLVANMTAFHEFAEVLKRERLLKEILLSETPYIIRYVKGEVNILALAVSISSNTHISHYTALVLHKLIQAKELDPIYLTREQSAKKIVNSRDDLDQEVVDKVFLREQRVSQITYEWKGYRIILLKGKNSDQLGTIPFRYLKEKVLVTDIERSLIDCTVRPQYAGGIKNVIEAFSASKNKIVAEKLFHYLTELDFIYPYHQSIGFLLEYTNYPEETINLFKQLPRKINFYLDYALNRKVLNTTWNVYIPEELKK